jgi:hypothetical protein
MNLNTDDMNDFIFYMAEYNCLDSSHCFQSAKSVHWGERVKDLLFSLLPKCHLIPHNCPILLFGGQTTESMCGPTATIACASQGEKNVPTAIGPAFPVTHACAGAVLARSPSY